MADRCSSIRGFIWLVPAKLLVLFVGRGLGLQGGEDSIFVSGVKLSGCISCKFGATPPWRTDELKTEVPVLVELVAEPIPRVSDGVLPESSCDPDTR